MKSIIKRLVAKIPLGVSRVEGLKGVVPQTWCCKSVYCQYQWKNWIYGLTSHTTYCSAIDSWLIDALYS